MRVKVSIRCIRLALLAYDERCPLSSQSIKNSAGFCYFSCHKDLSPQRQKRIRNHAGSSLGSSGLVGPGWPGVPANV